MRGTRAKWLRREAAYIVAEGESERGIYKAMKAFSKPKPAIGKVVEPRRRKSTQKGLRNFLVGGSGEEIFAGRTRLNRSHWAPVAKVIELMARFPKERVLHSSYDSQTVAQFKVKEQ